MSKVSFIAKLNDSVIRHINTSNQNVKDLTELNDIHIDTITRLEESAVSRDQLSTINDKLNQYNNLYNELGEMKLSIENVHQANTDLARKMCSLQEELRTVSDMNTQLVKDVKKLKTKKLIMSFQEEVAETGEGLE
jgi:vacuolar-type H+-ATPase subunit I/STV1